MKLLQTLLEGIEDEHADVYEKYLMLKDAGKLSPQQIKHFEKLNRGFDMAYNDQDPYGNDEYDYLNDMIELLDSVSP